MLLAGCNFTTWDEKVSINNWNELEFNRTTTYASASNVFTFVTNQEKTFCKMVLFIQLNIIFN